MSLLWLMDTTNFTLMLWYLQGLVLGYYYSEGGFMI